MSGQSGNSSIGVTIVVSALTSALVTVATLVGVQRYAGGELATTGGAPVEAAAAAEVRVPEVVRMTREGADEVLADRQLRLVVSSERADKDLPKGTVLEQTPLPGSRVAGGSTITVVISSGVDALVVPPVIGLQEAQAKASVEALGLTLGPAAKGGEGAPGTVTAVVPPQGSAVVAGQAVSLTVAGPAGIVVPDVRHISSRRAREKFEQAGLVLGRVRERYDENMRAYMVLEQDPPAGSTVEAGTKVNLVVNEGD